MHHDQVLLLLECILGVSFTGFWILLLQGHRWSEQSSGYAPKTRTWVWWARTGCALAVAVSSGIAGYMTNTPLVLVGAVFGMITIWFALISLAPDR